LAIETSVQAFFCPILRHFPTLRLRFASYVHPPLPFHHRHAGKSLWSLKQFERLVDTLVLVVDGPPPPFHRQGPYSLPLLFGFPPDLIRPLRHSRDPADGPFVFPPPLFGPFIRTSLVLGVSRYFSFFFFPLGFLLEMRCHPDPSLSRILI